MRHTVYYFVHLKAVLYAKCWSVYILNWVTWAAQNVIIILSHVVVPIYDHQWQHSKHNQCILRSAYLLLVGLSSKQSTEELINVVVPINQITLPLKAPSLRVSFSSYTYEYLHAYPVLVAVSCSTLLSACLCRPGLITTSVVVVTFQNHDVVRLGVPRSSRVP